MGYEHKLIIANGYSNYNEVIAEIKLSRFDDFDEDKFFTEKLNGTLWVDDEERTTDYYGKELKYTKDFKKLANWLEEQNDKEYYRRLPQVIALLRGFNPSDWEDLKVIHFGY